MSFSIRKISIFWLRETSTIVKTVQINFRVPFVQRCLHFIVRVSSFFSCYLYFLFHVDYDVYNIQLTYNIWKTCKMWFKCDLRKYLKTIMPLIPKPPTPLPNKTYSYNVLTLWLHSLRHAAYNSIYRQSWFHPKEDFLTSVHRAWRIWVLIGLSSKLTLTA